jgi:GTP-binding protein
MKGQLDARFICGASSAAQFPRLPYPEVAFCGRSNVGKSSLLNRLVGVRKLARVSKTPGRTQQVNFFLVDNWVTFVDLPGYGFAQVPLAMQRQWARLVESYFQQRSQLKLVVVLVDLRRGLEEEDQKLLDWLDALGRPFVLVATKADKTSQSERVRGMRRLQEQLAGRSAEVLLSSAKTGEGIPDLWRVIKRYCAKGE